MDHDNVIVTIDVTPSASFITLHGGETISIADLANYKVKAGTYVVEVKLNDLRDIITYQMTIIISEPVVLPFINVDQQDKSEGESSEEAT